MGPFARWFAWLTNLVVGGTGLVLLWMFFLPEPEDPFAVAVHPLQPWHGDQRDGYVSV